ncbi:MAG: TlpA family protein disulfide reductase [Anaerolineales bacterium]|nr:TlpA family protein disulfide reductase [Anaerolineales bacterium]
MVLNFWASWCKPCEQEATELEEAWQFYEARDDVMFLGIDYVDTEPEARTFLKKFQITYPNAPDLRTSISQMFRITGVPETYFIDKNGVLYYIKVGPFVSVEEIKSIIEQELQ